jgi:hypothetical protein
MRVSEEIGLEAGNSPASLLHENQQRSAPSQHCKTRAIAPEYRNPTMIEHISRCGCVARALNSRSSPLPKYKLKSPSHHSNNTEVTNRMKKVRMKRGMRLSKR